MIFEEMTANEMEQCAQIAADAFLSYEYFSMYIPNEKRRKKFLHALLKCEFKANANLDTVKFMVARENGKIVAVAHLCSPDFVKPSDQTYVKCGWIGVMLKGGIKAVNAWNDMEKEASHPCHALKGKVWYLSLLTVEQSQEGKGIGSRFMQECLIPYTRSQGAESLCLFTNSEENRAFYRKNGFTEFDEKRFSYLDKSIGSWSYIMNF